MTTRWVYLGGLLIIVPLLCMRAAALEPKALEQVVTPSGIEVRLQEMLWDRPGGGLVYRFRFVTDEFDGYIEDYDKATFDLKFLCNDYALPRVASIGPNPSRIIVSLAEREIGFGEYDPTVAQIFEAYRINNGVCIWEIF